MVFAILQFDCLLVPKCIKCISSSCGCGVVRVLWLQLIYFTCVWLLQIVVLYCFFWLVRRLRRSNYSVNRCRQVFLTVILSTWVVCSLQWTCSAFASAKNFSVNRCRQVFFTVVHFEHVSRVLLPVDVCVAWYVPFDETVLHYTLLSEPISQTSGCAIGVATSM